MGFGGNQAFEKFSNDVNGSTFQQGQGRSGFQILDEGSLKHSASNYSNMYSIRPRQTSSNAALTGTAFSQYQQQQQQQQPAQVQLHAWSSSATFQAVPNIAVFGDYSDQRQQQQSIRAFPTANVTQQQQQHNHFQQQQQHFQHNTQLHAFYPDLLRGQTHKSQRTSSPMTIDTLSSDGLPLEPKRRTRRRRRRPRKTDSMELAATMLGNYRDTRFSPSSFDVYDDDDLDAEDTPVSEPTSLLASVSTPSALSSLSSVSSSSGRSSFLDSESFPTPAAPISISNDPWRSEVNQSAFEFLFDEEVVPESCFFDTEPLSQPSSPGHLSSCISQLFPSEAEDSHASRLQSKLKSALAWHEQIGDALYFARPL